MALSPERIRAGDTLNLVMVRSGNRFISLMGAGVARGLSMGTGCDPRSKTCIRTSSAIA